MEKRRIGLTGNIGCGKSTVAALLKQYPDIEILNTDRIAKEVMTEPGIKQMLIALLGGKAFIGHEINRSYIAGIMFSDKAAKQKVEAIVHRAVAKRITQLINKSTKKIFVIESAILYETGSEKNYESVILATCSPDEQILRLKKNRGMTEDEIAKRMAQQMLLSEKVSMADYVISTECDLNELNCRVRELYRKIKNA